MGSCDINHLKALTRQTSPETIWHIIVERKTFEVQFCLGEGKAVIKDYSVKHEFFLVFHFETGYFIVYVSYINFKSCMYRTYILCIHQKLKIIILE